MNGFNERLIPESAEISRTAAVNEINPEVLSEQHEMDAMAQTEAAEAQLVEQQEMDEFADSGKIGMRTIYYPDEQSERRGDKIGEYRIFADTRPTKPAYDVFADGK